MENAKKVEERFKNLDKNIDKILLFSSKKTFANLELIDKISFVKFYSFFE